MTDGVLTTEAEKRRALIAIKVLHNGDLGVLCGCIVAIPAAGWMRRFEAAWILTGVVLVECLVLAVNGGRCPLTPIAGRFTEDRTGAFDIYLPGWLARWNKELFGGLFVAGVIITLWLRFHSR
jgi:hypothetical protein